MNKYSKILLITTAVLGHSIYSSDDATNTTNTADNLSSPSRALVPHTFSSPATSSSLVQNDFSPVVVRRRRLPTIPTLGSEMSVIRYDDVQTDIRGMLAQRQQLIQSLESIAQHGIMVSQAHDIATRVAGALAALKQEYAAVTPLATDIEQRMMSFNAKLKQAGIRMMIKGLAIVEQETTDVSAQKPVLEDYHEKLKALESSKSLEKIGDLAKQLGFLIEDTTEANNNGSSTATQVPTTQLSASDFE